MYNQSILKEIEELQKKYETRWGKTIRDFDLSLLPRHISQEQLILILRRIVDTGESCLVGFDKIKEISLNYYYSLDWSTQYNDNDILNKSCPFCGNNVRIHIWGKYRQHSCIHCETSNCLHMVSRGL